MIFVSWKEKLQMLRKEHESSMIQKLAVITFESLKSNQFQ